MSKEYVLKRLESLGLIDNQQITQAFISMYTSSSKKDGFPICELILKGISSRYEADLVALTVSLNGEKVKSVNIPVIKDDFNKYRVTIDPSVVEKLTKKTAECSVVAVDKYGRELVSVSSIIKFDILNEIPSIDSTISFVDSIRVSGDDIRSDVAEITLLTDLSTSVCVELSNSDEVLWQNNIHLISGTPVNHVVSVNSSVIDDSKELRIVIRNDGGVIAEKSKFITVERDIVDPPKQNEVLNVIGDLILPDFIDTHTVVEDYVSVGELALLNKGEDSDIIVSVIFDGTDLLCFRMHMMAGDRSIGLSAPFTRLAREETYACEMIAHVTDILGNTLIHKVCTLMVRSKYDMNLRELRLRSAQFVNPRNKLVSEMVENSNSLLATSMCGRYMVQGYQNGGSDIIRQMEAVYVMMNQMGIRYVSDTFSFNRSSENYQHVRAPDRVMLDKSGNCLELCILYASFMEVMGLESVIVFPPGHSIVGVVLGTDVYNSTSDYNGPDDAPYVVMDVGDKKAFVMFIETTMCPFNKDFYKAVMYAKKEIEDNIDYVNRPENHVFIKQMRLNGVYPIIGL